MKDLPDYLPPLATGGRFPYSLPTVLRKETKTDPSYLKMVTCPKTTGKVFRYDCDFGYCKNRSKECDNLDAFLRETTPFSWADWTGISGFSTKNEIIHKEEEAYSNVTWSWPEDPDKEPF